MNFLIVGFLVKLIDIPAAAIGLVGGWHAKSWLHLVIIAFIGGSAGEIILYMREDTREFGVIIWLVGVAACFAWTVMAFWIRSWLSRSN